MASQFNLLTTRRFLPMFLTQFFGALNDNVFKQSLLLVFTYQLISSSTYNTSTLNNLAALLFVLPYFLFSATAGQIADRYEKANLTRWLKGAEFVIMSLATIGFLTKQLWLLLLALFLMGTHSTFFGPIKYAILPQILTEKELMSGNALFQTGTSLAILFGMILGGVVMAQSDGNLIWISLTVISIAIAGFISARFLLQQPINAPTLKINWNFLSTSVSTLKYSYQIPPVFFAIQGLPKLDSTALSTQLLGIGDIFAQSAYWRVMFDIVMLGLSGGFYIVPLYAYLQEKSPETHRARIIASNNILNALFMVVSAVISIVVLSMLKLSLASLFLFTALLNAVVCFFVLKKLRQLPNISKQTNI